MRFSILSFAIAPLAFLSFGGLEAKAYPTVGYTESITCAAIGNDRMMRAAWGCPVINTSHSPQVTESLMCAYVGNDRIYRALLGCPIAYPYLY